MFNSKMFFMNMPYAASTGARSACAYSACRNIVNILDAILMASIIIFALVCLAELAALAISLLVLISLVLLGMLLVYKNSKMPEANTCS